MLLQEWCNEDVEIIVAKLMQIGRQSNKMWPFVASRSSGQPANWRHFSWRGPMLKISKADYDLIRWEAERSYPNECCGIILGVESEEQRVVTLTITCENTRQDSPKDRYSIHPEQVVAAHKLARSRGEKIIGFYHSHPDHAARYSSTDLAEAHWFDCSYVITSVAQGHAEHMNSFVLRGNEDRKHFAPEDIEVTSYEADLKYASL
jgi:proteasome lid subunit RPN8/RPN11